MAISYGAVDKENLKLIFRTYLNGYCYVLALAMHRGLGWPIVGLVAEKGEIVHAGVRSPEGDIWDARGKISDEDFREYSAGDFRIMKITEEDLQTRSKIFEHAIEKAQRRAQIMWEHLPWKKDSYAQKVFDFATELEALSRKYKLWIGGIKPPAIFDGMDDEASYELSLTPDGNGYTIGRKLE